MVLYVYTKITVKGIQLSFKRGAVSSRLEAVFPHDVWGRFPSELKSVLRDNLAYLSSVELALMFGEQNVEYDTPFPLFKPFLNELFLRSLTYAGDCDMGKGSYYVTLFNAMNFSFQGERLPLRSQSFPLRGGVSINTMSFGKESLLGLGLAREIGLKAVPVMVMEPDLDVAFRGERIKSYAHQHFNGLMEQFQKEFAINIVTVQNQLASLRCNVLWNLDDSALGDAAMLTQYLFLLLPLAYYYNAGLIVFGNEYSSDDVYMSKDNVKCSTTFDQSAEWMEHMNALTSIIFQGKVVPTSLVQPLREMAVCKVLYQRYPALAKYQMSCFVDEDGGKHSRWCRACAKCACCYVFMRALGFDPRVVGFGEMFSLKYKDLYAIFNRKDNTYYSSPLAVEEQLLAFHLAIKRGATGELVDLYKEKFGIKIAAREKELRRKYLTVQQPQNIPNDLWKKLKPIFEEELQK